LTSCGEGGGSAKFKFRNAPPPASLSVRSARSAMEGTTVNEASYSEITEYYKSLKIVAKYTPSTFRAYNPVISGNLGYIVNDDWTDPKIIDFMQGTAIEVGRINEGFYTELHILYAFTEIVDSSKINTHIIHPAPTTTFTIETPLHAEHDWYKPQSQMTGVQHDGSPIYSNGAPYTIDGKTITLPTMRLFAAFSPGSTFLYTGKEYKYERVFPSANYSSRNIGGFVTPWAGAFLSNDSNNTYNINWDLTDIIEQRCPSWDGSEADHSCPHCRFVLANKFWERLSLTVE